MGKIWLRTFAVLLFCVSLFIQIINGQTSSKLDIENMISLTIEDLVYNNVYFQYQKLNLNLLGSDFWEEGEKELVEEQALQYADKVKGEFMPKVSNNSSFPEGIVALWEEFIYKNVGKDFSYQMWKQYQFDFLVREDSEVHLLFPKANVYSDLSETYASIQNYYGIPEHCLSIYHINFLENRDNYVFEYILPGTERKRIRLTERIDDEFVTIQDFKIPSGTETIVMQYGGEFYCVISEKNIRTLEEDGIWLYKLNYEPNTECLLIRYLPEKYIGEEYYFKFHNSQSTQSVEEDKYLDKIMANFGSGEFLDDGIHGGIIYNGDEEIGFSWTSDDTVFELYKEDFANCNLPVYIHKEQYVSKSYAERTHLKVDFSYFVSEKNQFINLDKLSIQRKNKDGFGEGRLIQMWFREIDGKVYTFRVYHVSDYNYLLNMSLVERNKVFILRTYFLSPKRKFVLINSEVEF